MHAKSLTFFLNGNVDDVIAHDEVCGHHVGGVPPEVSVPHVQVPTNVHHGRHNCTYPYR